MGHHFSDDEIESTRNDLLSWCKIHGDLWYAGDIRLHDEHDGTWFEVLVWHDYNGQISLPDHSNSGGIPNKTVRVPRTAVIVEMMERFGSGQMRDVFQQIWQECGPRTKRAWQRATAPLQAPLRDTPDEEYR